MLKKLLTVRNLVIALGVVAVFVVSGLLGLRVPNPEVSVAAEPVFHIGAFAVTNALVTAWLVMILLIVIAYFATRHIPKDLEAVKATDLAPQNHFQNAVEYLIEGWYGLVQGVAGSWAPRFFPIVMTIFLFVIFSNWFGLIPGFGSIGILHPVHEAGQQGFVVNGAVLTAEKASPGTGYVLVPIVRSPSTDLNFTIGLALITQVLAQYWGFRALGGKYFKRFFDLSGFREGVFGGIVGLFVGLLELISEISKIISFSFRLFGNIFAGEVLLAVMAFLIPYIASLPFYGLEIFVGFIQALVFMMLALVFFTVATISHGEHGPMDEHSGATGEQASPPPGETVMANS